MDPLTPDNLPAEEAQFREIMTSIVKRFMRLLGAPATLSIANRIPHLVVDDEGNVQSYNKDDPAGTIAMLLDQYSGIFGDAALSLARQATKPAAKPSRNNIPQETDVTASRLSPPMRILLVDDHVLFRNGLVSLIAPQPDMQVVGQAGCVREAITLAHELKPDVVMMDISLPDGTGIEAAQEIMVDLPETKIMFLTVHDDDERLFAAIRAGGVGYSLKNVRADELLKSLRGIAKGEAAITRSIARRILEEFSHTQTQQPLDPSEKNELTVRETEVLRELARGATNREIAEHYIISENTVKNHVRNVLSKLHLHSRRDVIDYARNHGLTSSLPGSPRPKRRL